jgi:type I restriction enzyme S subunit
MNNEDTFFDCMPEDWDVVRIGSAFDIKQGKSLSSRKQTGKNLKPFLRTSNVFWGRLDLSHLDEMDFTDDECKALTLEYGDLLVCEGGDIGRTAIWRNEKTECYYQNHLHRLRVKDKKIEPLFIMYWMQVALTQLGIYEGFGNKTTIPNLSSSRLREFILPLPEKKEQQKIAAILSKIQQAIEIQESIIAKMRELKKSTLHYVFTHGLRGENTKETEIGQVPESWIIKKIGDLGKIVTGTTPPTKNKEYYQGGHYQFIAPNDIGKTTRIYKAEKKITDKGLEVSRLLPIESVCFVCIGSTIGKVGITVEEKTTTNQQINTVIVNHDSDPYFVTYLMDYKSEYIASFASPSPVPILSKGKFEEISIMLSPNMTEQQEIARVLMIIDETIEIHAAKKSALQELFKAMLNKLMTGEIRVKDLDIDVSEVSA